MGTLKMAKHGGYAVETSSAAIDYLYKENGYRSVIIYAINKKKLLDVCAEVYEEIKKRNSQIQDINQQMLPTGPYIWDDIDGCLGVKCAEISMDVFENAAGCLYMFSQPMYACLTDPNARKPLSSKALTSLAMMGWMVSGGGTK